MVISKLLVTFTSLVPDNDADSEVLPEIVDQISHHIPRMVQVSYDKLRDPAYCDGCSVVNLVERTEGPYITFGLRCLRITWSSALHVVVNADP